MIYKEFSTSGEPKTIGVNNGVYQIYIDKSNFKSDQEYTAFILKFPQDSLQKIEINEPLKFRLLKKGKINDFMSYAEKVHGVPFLISQSALDVLKSHSLKQFSLIDIVIDGYEGNEKFYMFRYPFTELYEIGFEELIVYTGNEFSGKKYNSIKSYEEFLEFKKKTLVFSFEKIIIKSHNNLEDFIRLRGAGGFVTPKLEQAIIENKLTGPAIGHSWSAVLEVH